MDKRFRVLNDNFIRLPSAIRGTFVVAITLGMAIVDTRVSEQIDISGFFLIPLFLSVWYFRTPTVFIPVFAITLFARLEFASFAILSSNHYWVVATSFVSIVLGLSLFSLLVLFLKRYVIKIQIDSERDQLTGLRNRRHFLSLAEYELTRRSRLHYPLSVAMLDVDGFKKLNDTQGHKIGDRLLVALSECLEDTLRNSDIIGRVGGDEFAIVLPHTTYEQTLAALNRLESNLQPVFQSFKSDGLGCSIGAVHLNESTQNSDITSLLDAADRVMYEVKRNGKNHVLVRAFVIS